MTSQRGILASLVAWAMGLALACVSHVAHLQLSAASAELPQRKDAKEALPTVGALKLMSLGYRNLVADYYWLRAVSHFGDRAMHKQLYPNLGPLLQRTVGLDPLFAGAYVFAGQSLTFAGMDYAVPMALLKQGLRMRPDDWRIAFYLGFNAYYLQQDYGLATQALGVASRMPQAPPFVAPLAARLSVEAGTPEMGISLMDTMIAGTQEPKLRSQYEERRTLLVLEQRLRDLQKAVDAYAAAQGQPPASLQALVDAKLLSQVSDDPLGGPFLLNGGTVETIHSNQRLRMRKGAVLEQKHASD